MGSGAILVSQTLRAMIADGAIQALVPVRPEQIQPSSLDIRLGARLWQLHCSFLPAHTGVERKLGRLATAVHRLDRDQPMVLQFDEADALFAKRGEIKEARDRYANMASIDE